MPRRLAFFSIVLIALSVTACTKSEEDDRRAHREIAGLMPDNDPKYESEFVADQSQVKLVAARTVSYEPLETFRGKSKSKGEDEPVVESKPAKVAATPARPNRAGAQPPQRPAGSSGGGPGFWSRVGMKALMGGGPPTGAGAAPQAKGGKPAPKGDKADEKKKSSDEEESEEEDSEDSGDKESKDSDSNGN